MAKKAVLIGINRYRIPGSDLRGCVNDVRNMQSVLTHYYGFGAGDVTILTDGAATKKAMQKSIADLVTRAKKGDVILVHYSGHGSNVPDDNGDEADKRDEILCPNDLDWNDPLTDDWLRKTFNRLKAGVNLTVVFDCCHSGTATRAIMPPDAPSIPRYLPCPLDLLATESGRKLRGRVRRGMRASKPAARKKGDVAIADIGEVLITGCRDTQTSADAHIGGAYNGALTYHLVAAIKAHDGHLTNRELHTATRAALAQANFDQVPQLEAQKEHLDRPFLAPLD